MSHPPQAAEKLPKAQTWLAIRQGAERLSNRPIALQPID